MVNLGLKAVWDAVCDWEPYRMHPVLAELDPSERGKLIPMFLFADGYEVHRRSEYYAWLWCSGLSMTGSSFDSVFPIAVVRHACMPTLQINAWCFGRYIGT